MAKLLQQFEARIDRRLQEQTQMIESLKASSTALSSGTSSEPSSDSQDFPDFGDARDESENQNRANDQDSSWDVSTIFFLLFTRIFFFSFLFFLIAE
jgi:hypothetical protein